MDKLEIQHIQYLCGNPAVELIEGYIYYYSLDSTIRQLRNRSKLNSTNVLLATMIPCHLSPAEFAQFIIACCNGKHYFDLIKILHGLDPFNYLCLIFCDPQYICKLYECVNNVPYNPLESATCSLFIVKHITTGCNYKHFAKPKQGIQEANLHITNNNHFRVNQKDIIIKKAKQMFEKLRSQTVELYESCECKIDNELSQKNTMVSKISKSLTPRGSVNCGNKSFSAKKQQNPSFININNDKSGSSNRENMSQSSHEISFGSTSSSDILLCYDLIDIFHDNEWAQLFVKQPKEFNEETRRSNSLPAKYHKNKKLEKNIQSLSQLKYNGIKFSNDVLFLHPANILYQYAAPAYCAVCLERVNYFMKSTQMEYQKTDLPCINILCGHTFHAHCLLRWNDLTCPCCRYQQYPTRPTCCDICGQTAKLTMCMICGFIGCFDAKLIEESKLGGGSLEQSLLAYHSYQHYIDYRHVYALEIFTQKLWDFASNAYIQRLLQNIEDGKIVPIADPQSLETNKIEDELYEAKCIDLLHTYLASLQDYYDKQLIDFQVAASQIIKEAKEQHDNLVILLKNKERILEALENKEAETSKSIEEKKIQLANLEKEEHLLLILNEKLRKKDQEINEKTQEEVAKLELILKQKKREQKDLMELVEELQNNIKLAENFRKSDVSTESNMLIMHRIDSKKSKKKHKKH